MSAADVSALADRALAAWRPDEELLAVVGATGSGKSALALALAERVGGELVSADSVQIVRGFDLGSAKPSALDRARVAHHLIDAVDPLDDIDAARFTELADAAIADIRARGRVPIVCGGTFLWVRALVRGLADAPPRAPSVRLRHAELVTTHGPLHLHALLAQVDADSAARLHPNDVLRVGRALEVYETTGKRLSELQRDHGFRSMRHATRFVAPAVERATLHERIDARIERWLASGWIEEVEALVARGYGGARAMGSLGYREIHAHLRGELARDALGDAIGRATKLFARRQRTWLHHEDVLWL